MYSKYFQTFSSQDYKNKYCPKLTNVFLCINVAVKKVAVHKTHQLK